MENKLSEEESEEFDWCDWVSLDIRNETDIIKACVHLKRNLKKGENIDFLQDYFFEGVQGLLDLYCSKTEQLNTALNSINYWKNLYDDTFAEYEKYKGKHSIIKRHYVSKDKIKEIIYPTPDNPISYEIQTSDIYKKLEQLLEEE